MKIIQFPWISSFFEILWFKENCIYLLSREFATNLFILCKSVASFGSLLLLNTLIPTGNTSHLVVCTSHLSNMKQSCQTIVELTGCR